MKKILFAICIMLFATPAFAVCDDEHGGIPVAGGYCRSKFNLNWCSAFMWCEGIGMDMVSMYDICPDWEGRLTDVCPSLDTTQAGVIAWTTTPNGTLDAYRVDLSSGAINNISTRGNNHSFYALCK